MKRQKNLKITIPKSRDDPPGVNCNPISTAELNAEYVLLHHQLQHMNLLFSLTSEQHRKRRTISEQLTVIQLHLRFRRWEQRHQR